jgi:hypothetical protein
LNDHYLQAAEKIGHAEVEAFVNGLVAGMLADNAKEAINTQAWILHMMNPSEAWANLRRSDYPVLMDRTKLAKFDFTYDDNNLNTPTRLRYPILENQYNHNNYNEAIERIGSKNDKGEYVDDWHKRLWWDVADIHVK